MEKIILNEAQQEALDIFIENKDEDFIYSLEGKAGTGKSTLTSKMIKHLYDEDKVIACIAPTHQALKVLKKMVTKVVGNSWKVNGRIKFATVHSYLGLTLQIDEDGNEIFGKSSFNKYQSRIECDYLFCDESSMVSDDLSKKIVGTLTNNNPQVKKQIIYIGDPYQLKPVQGDFNFILDKNNRSRRGFKIKHLNLNEIVRQAEGSSIIKLAHEITKMIDNNKLYNEEKLFNLLYKETKCLDKIILDDAELFMDKYFQSKEMEEDKIVGCYTNKLVNDYNKYIRFMNLKDEYLNEDNNISGLPDIVPGERIVFLQPYERNQKLLANNGDTCKINKVSLKYTSVQNVDLKYYHCVAHLEDSSEGSSDLGTRISINILHPDSKEAFENKCKELANDAKRAHGKAKGFLWKKFFSFKNKYAMVRNIYANTNHKLQGSTFNEVYLNTMEYKTFLRYDLDNILRLIYVAITRGKKIIMLKEK
jgi:exodeoxyribonuclease-5